METRDGNSQTYKWSCIHPLISRCLTSHKRVTLLPVLWIPFSPAFTWTLLPTLLGILNLSLSNGSISSPESYTKLEKKKERKENPSVKTENLTHRPLTEGPRYCTLKSIPAFARDFASPRLLLAYNRKRDTNMSTFLRVMELLWWLTLVWGCPNGFLNLPYTAQESRTLLPKFPSFSPSLSVSLSAFSKSLPIVSKQVLTLIKKYSESNPILMFASRKAYLNILQHHFLLQLLCSPSQLSLWNELSVLPYFSVSASSLNSHQFSFNTYYPYYSIQTALTNVTNYLCVTKSNIWFLISYFTGHQHSSIMTLFEMFSSFDFVRLCSPCFIPNSLLLLSFFCCLLSLLNSLLELGPFFF